MMTTKNLIKLNNQLNFDYIEQGLKEQVAFNLRQIRNQLGIGQARMAELTDQSCSQYRRHEKGVDLPRLHTAIRWSLETGIPTQCLFLGSRYQPYIDFVVPHSWIPLLFFINQAPIYSLQAFQALLEGLSRIPLKGSLRVHSPSLDVCRNQIGERYYRVIAEQLRNFRTLHKVTQEDIASSIGLSVLTYRGYESTDKQVQFSVNMIMRFWASTGVNPLMLTQNSSIYLYRQTQKHNLELMRPALLSLSDSAIRRLVVISKHLNHFTKENIL